MHRFEICSKLIIGVGREMGTFGRKLYQMCNLCMRACVCVCVCDVECVCVWGGGGCCAGVLCVCGCVGARVGMSACVLAKKNWRTRTSNGPFILKPTNYF